MPKNVRCAECGLALLALESLGPTPLGRDECPNCGGAEFSFE
ncbi:hypothetical protein [Halopelagius fulvigenes]|uniref:Small CPxCG-related zinc finger protein n=1 Tax=Halopelagius fulvigenes TaxID=1198324 RepID=A0ABD5TTY0_9EURY